MMEHLVHKKWIDIKEKQEVCLCGSVRVYAKYEWKCTYE